MKKFTKSIRRALDIARRRGAVVAATVLVLLALVVGYRLGSGGGAPADTAATRPATAGGAGAAPQMYTCAMHPSVRLPDPDAKCPICFMDLVPVVAGDGDQGGTRPQMVLSEAAVELSEIETTRVERFFPTAEVRLYGKVTYDETSVARITSYFPGRIERLFVNYVGVPVNKGEHLAEMYSPQLLAAFEEVRQARLAVERSDAASEIVRESTRLTLVAAREKLRLFGLTVEQIRAAEAGESSGDRLTVFSPISGIVTHLAAREGDYVQTGSPIATVSDLSRLWLDMEAYESQLPLLQWGQPVTFTVEAHPGEVFEGRISFIEPMVDERTRTAAVRVAVDNADRRLKPGMFASAVARPRVAASGAVPSNELAGRWVGPMHPTIVRDEPGQCPICGMNLVTAESLGVVGDPSAVEPPLVVPRSAVLFTGTRSLVYVQDPEAASPTYEPREVMLGPRAGDYYTIRSGLAEGEAVVVKGAFRIDSAMQIAAKPSMMMPGSGGPASTSGPASFAAQLQPVYAAYFDAQESLADDDLERFAMAMRNLAGAVGAVRETGLVDAPRNAWRRAAAGLRLDGPVETIEQARSRFEGISEAVIGLQRRFGHGGDETWHLVFCPMAFDFKGALWLQRAAEIDNPFFGAAMLRCGEVRESFPPRPAPAAGGPGGHGHE